MNCRKITSLLVDYNEDALTAEEKKMVEEHLRVCESCRKELKEIQSLFGVLEREKTENVEDGSTSCRRSEKRYFKLPHPDSNGILFLSWDPFWVLS
jgi:predicted anti-sigma-YlaC factor YlaD